MKTITVKWIPHKDFVYGRTMKVIESNHKKFTVGTEFSFELFHIVSDEGYTVTLLPLDPNNED